MIHMEILRRTFKYQILYIWISIKNSFGPYSIAM